MCDYSLHGVASRPAKIGDRLVTTRFATTFTRGFAAIDARDIAVCLQPGTEVAFDRDAEVDAGYGFLPNRSLKDRVARFREINLDRPNVHHDALEFPTGEIVPLTRMAEGQTATVLQLPAAAVEEARQVDTEGRRISEDV
jgi:hypothetical protein